MQGDIGVSHLEVSSSWRSSADQLSPGPPTCRCREMQGGAGRCRQMQARPPGARPRRRRISLYLPISRCISPRSRYISAHLEPGLDEHGAVAEQRTHVGEHAPAQGEGEGEGEGRVPNADPSQAEQSAHARVAPMSRSTHRTLPISPHISLYLAISPHISCRGARTARSSCRSPRRRR